MTIAGLLTEAESLIARSGIEPARCEAEWMLAHVLGFARSQLLFKAADLVQPQDELRLRELVRERVRRVPLQHLLGSASFCGLEMIVDRRVLVPRPETETLAECAWTFARKLTAPKILDAGTGSGCIAIAIAKHAPEAVICAMDDSAAALAVAEKNVSAHQLAARITLVRGNFFNGLPDIHFDLIVSNPPYIPTAEIAALAPEVRDHDPRFALDGGADGLAAYRRLAQHAFPRTGKSGGTTLMMELGDGQGPAVREILQSAGWTFERLLPDLSGCERIIIANAVVP